MIIRNIVNSLLFMEEIKNLRQLLTQITLKNWIQILKKLTFPQPSTEGEHETVLKPGRLISIIS